METVRRGYEPKDAVEFGPKAAVKLSSAGQELVYLEPIPKLTVDV